MTKINTNVSSLNSHRAVLATDGLKARATERLSTGKRINRAADDAAGLAISEGMRNQIKGMNQAIANSQDGINLIATAEGAIAEINEMIMRIRELVVQAANDTNLHDYDNVGRSDRAMIQAEIDQLLDEIDSIALRTEFNRRSLLEGTWSRIARASIIGTILPPGEGDPITPLSNITFPVQIFEYVGPPPIATVALTLALYDDYGNTLGMGSSAESLHGTQFTFSAATPTDEGLPPSGFPSGARSFRLVYEGSSVPLPPPLGIQPTTIIIPAGMNIEEALLSLNNNATFSAFLEEPLTVDASTGQVTLKGRVGNLRDTVPYGDGTRIFSTPGGYGALMNGVSVSGPFQALRLNQLNGAAGQTSSSFPATREHATDAKGGLDFNIPANPQDLLNYGIRFADGTGGSFDIKFVQYPAPFSYPNEIVIGNPSNAADEAAYIMDRIQTILNDNGFTTPYGITDNGGGSFSINVEISGLSYTDWHEISMRGLRFSPEHTPPPTPIPGRDAITFADWENAITRTHTPVINVREDQETLAFAFPANISGDPPSAVTVSGFTFVFANPPLPSNASALLPSPKQSFNTQDAFINAIHNHLGLLA